MTIAFVFKQLEVPENTNSDPWSVVAFIACVSAIVIRNLSLSPGTDTTTIFQEYLIHRSSGTSYTVSE
jgi:hypothetical protein